MSRSSHKSLPRGDRGEEPTPPGSLRRRLQFTLPMALGVTLVALFVFLLWKQEERGTASIPAPPGPSRTMRPAWEIPPGDPSDPYSRPKPPAGEGLKRWNLEKLPEGWDSELALRIARYFAAMDISGTNDERLLTLEENRVELREFLKSLGPEAIPTLTAILNAEMDFVNRRFILYALGDLGPRSEEATFALRDFYEESRGQSEARTELNHVIKAMGNLKNDTAFQSMNDYIDDPGTSSYDRDKFIQALGEHPRREEAVPRFVERMREDQDTNTRNHSAQALGKIRKAEALSELISAYEREPVWPVRQTILGSIGKIADASTLGFLEQEARTAEPSGVRLSASSAIRRIGTARARSVLQSIASGERDPSVRDHIESWLSNWSTPGLPPLSPPQGGRSSPH